MRGSGQSLTPAVRNFMEPRFGHDFSRVRIHTDNQATRLARQLKASAFTVGRDIAFGAGQYQPNTVNGQRLVAHELTHVVQQQGGHANLQRKMSVQDAPKKIPKPGGKGLDQTNGQTVENYLVKMCKSGSPQVKSNGDVDIGKAFCTKDAAKSKTPTSCGCVCDMAQSMHLWTIIVDDASWPHTVFDDSNAANGKTPGGTGGIVTTPSPNSKKLWGAATTTGKALDVDPWLVLGHELCGHGWLGNFGKHGPDQAKPRGEGGHQETVKRENLLRAEHGIDLRGTFKDPYCGESFWREKKKPTKIIWSRALDVCKKWRKDYNKKKKTTYKISDKIP